MRSIVSTHFGMEVSYSKNWVFYSETLWKTRWDQVLSMGSNVDFVESEPTFSFLIVLLISFSVVTWNDYGG